ncbi:hypothetical protein F5Y06DRAFT_257795 [Hypoxylon sp. FL0890]|nr:hypothetical protein F5Y06DRAFT_257795 [Hypoxylon sp. FL0890]
MWRRKQSLPEMSRWRAFYAFPDRSLELNPSPSSEVRRDKHHASDTIFILIDGLDDFDESRNAEDYYDLVQLIQNRTSQSEGKVKICVSSREFEAFATISRHQRIRLQNPTEEDIRTYVTERLKTHSSVRETRRSL